MKSNQLPSFKNFSKTYEEKKMMEASGVASRKLQKATEEYHEAQLELQSLQKIFISLAKDDPNREAQKQKILAHHKIVKQKEAMFAKALGDEDIEDLEI
jgi:hypothetical protein